MTKGIVLFSASLLACAGVGAFIMIKKYLDDLRRVRRERSGAPYTI